MLSHRGTSKGTTNFGQFGRDRMVITVAVATVQYILEFEEVERHRHGTCNRGMKQELQTFRTRRSWDRLCEIGIVVYGGRRRV